MAHPQLRITKQPDGEATIVVLAGELDLATASRVDQSLDTLQRADGQAVVVDCSELTFCDSTGLAALERHRPLVLRAPHPTVLRLLELTGLTELVEERPRRPA
jgi:anti-sigma B factor antagonist